MEMVKKAIRKVVILLLSVLAIFTTYLSVCFIIAQNKGTPVSIFGSYYFVDSNESFYKIKKAQANYLKTGDTILCKINSENSTKTTLTTINSITKTNEEYLLNVKTREGLNYSVKKDDFFGEAVVAPNSWYLTFLKLTIKTPVIAFGFTLFSYGLLAFISLSTSGKRKETRLIEEQAEDALFKLERRRKSISEQFNPSFNQKKEQSEVLDSNLISNEVHTEHLITDTQKLQNELMLKKSNVDRMEYVLTDELTLTDIPTAKQREMLYEEPVVVQPEQELPMNSLPVQHQPFEEDRISEQGAQENSYIIQQRTPVPPTFTVNKEKQIEDFTKETTNSPVIGEQEIKQEQNQEIQFDQNFDDFSMKDLRSEIRESIEKQKAGTSQTANTVLPEKDITLTQEPNEPQMNEIMAKQQESYEPPMNQMMPKQQEFIESPINQMIPKQQEPTEHLNVNSMQDPMPENIAQAKTYSELIHTLLPQTGEQFDKKESPVDIKESNFTPITKEQTTQKREVEEQQLREKAPAQPQNFGVDNKSSLMQPHLNNLNAKQSQESVLGNNARPQVNQPIRVKVHKDNNNGQIHLPSQDNRKLQMQQLQAQLDNMSRSIRTRKSSDSQGSQQMAQQRQPKTQTGSSFEKENQGKQDEDIDPQKGYINKQHSNNPIQYNHAHVPTAVLGPSESVLHHGINPHFEKVDYRDSWLASDIVIKQDRSFTKNELAPNNLNLPNQQVGNFVLPSAQDNVKSNVVRAEKLQGDTYFNHKLDGLYHEYHEAKKQGIQVIPSDSKLPNERIIQAEQQQIKQAALQNSPIEFVKNEGNVNRVQQGTVENWEAKQKDLQHHSTRFVPPLVQANAQQQVLPHFYSQSKQEQPVTLQSQLSAATREELQRERLLQLEKQNFLALNNQPETVPYNHTLARGEQEQEQQTNLNSKVTYAFSGLQHEQKLQAEQLETTQENFQIPPDQVSQPQGNLGKSTKEQIQSLERDNRNNIQQLVSANVAPILVQASLQQENLPHLSHQFKQEAPADLKSSHSTIVSEQLASEKPLVPQSEGVSNFHSQPETLRYDEKLVESEPMQETADQEITQGTLAQVKQEVLPVEQLQTRQDILQEHLQDTQSEVAVQKEQLEQFKEWETERAMMQQYSNAFVAPLAQTAPHAERAPLAADRPQQHTGGNAESAGVDSDDVTTQTQFPVEVENQGAFHWNNEPEVVNHNEVSVNTRTEDISQGDQKQDRQTVLNATNDEILQNEAQSIIGVQEKINIPEKEEILYTQQTAVENQNKQLYNNGQEIQVEEIVTQPPLEKSTFEQPALKQPELEEVAPWLMDTKTNEGEVFTQLNKTIPQVAKTENLHREGNEVFAKEAKVQPRQEEIDYRASWFASEIQQTQQDNLPIQPLWEPQLDSLAHEIETVKSNDNFDVFEEQQLQNNANKESNLSVVHNEIENTESFVNQDQEIVTQSIENVNFMEPELDWLKGKENQDADKNPQEDFFSKEDNISLLNVSQVQQENMLQTNQNYLQETLIEEGTEKLREQSDKSSFQFSEILQQTAIATTTNDFSPLKEAVAVKQLGQQNEETEQATIENKLIAQDKVVENVKKVEISNDTERQQAVKESNENISSFSSEVVQTQEAFSKLDQTKDNVKQTYETVQGIETKQEKLESSETELKKEQQEILKTSFEKMNDSITEKNASFSFDNNANAVHEKFFFQEENMQDRTSIQEEHNSAQDIAHNKGKFTQVVQETMNQEAKEDMRIVEKIQDNTESINENAGEEVEIQTQEQKLEQKLFSNSNSIFAKSFLRPKEVATFEEEVESKIVNVVAKEEIVQNLQTPIVVEKSEENAALKQFVNNEKENIEKQSQEKFVYVAPEKEELLGKTKTQTKKNKQVSSFINLIDGMLNK